MAVKAETEKAIAESRELYDQVLAQTSKTSLPQLIVDVLGLFSNTAGRAAFAAARVLDNQNRSGTGNLKAGFGDLNLVKLALGDRFGFGNNFVNHELTLIGNRLARARNSFSTSSTLFGDALNRAIARRDNLTNNPARLVEVEMDRIARSRLESNPNLPPFLGSDELITRRGIAQMLSDQLLVLPREIGILESFLKHVPTIQSELPLFDEILANLRAGVPNGPNGPFFDAAPFADGGVAGVPGHVASLSGGFGLDAFVPLPGGRRIPVNLNFGGGSGFGGPGGFSGGFGGGAAGGGGPGGLADSIESLAARSAASLGRGLGGALSRLIAGTESAGESFKRFGLDVLGQFKNIALGALRTSLFGSGGGGGAGGSGGGGIAGSLLSSLGNALFTSLTKAANGGVMTVGGPLALRRYAAGGVARRPRLALFGEGGRPEAFVPLPDGRAIPVTMSGGGAGGLNVEINVAVDEPATASGAGGAEAARALARTVADAVRAELEGLVRAPRRA